LKRGLVKPRRYAQRGVWKAPANVALGLAVARPAEFIILRFSHQLSPG